MSYLDCFVRESIVIYQGDFTSEDYKLKLTNTLDRKIENGNLSGNENEKYKRAYEINKPMV